MVYLFQCTTWITSNTTCHISHVRYGEEEAVFTIPEGEMIDGILTKRKRKLVEAWIEIHHEDLMADWSLAVIGEKVFPIEPLK